MTKQQRIQLVDDINAFIVNNPTLFAANSTMTWKDFLAHFTQFFPYLKGAKPLGARRIVATNANYPFINAYNSLNKCLAAHGLYMKSKGSCTSFKILDASNTQKRLAAYAKHERNLADRRNELALGVRFNNGIPAVLSAAQKAYAVDRIAAQCLSHPYN